MKNTDLKDGEQYYLIPSYTMKCRLYPNKAAQKAIDDAIYSVGRACNMMQYDMRENGINVTERVGKNGEVVHFPDLKAAAKADYLKTISDGKAPAGALSGKNGAILSDMKKQFSGDLQKREKRTMLPLEKTEPHYYSKRRPRRSYTYQEKLSKVTQSDNPHVFYMTLAKVGKVKVRGWNQRLRFGEQQELNFVEYAMDCKSNKYVTVTIKKDVCGDYWICFKLADVYRPMAVVSDQAVGVDVGVRDVAILSNGKKFANKRFRKCSQHGLKTLDRQLSRRQGYSNIAFRQQAKQCDEPLMPSKRYLATRLAHAKFERKIARRRENYNHFVTYRIVADFSFIGVESLSIKSMQTKRSLSRALSDAAMGNILTMLSYKASWYGRTIQAIDRWIPSSKQCFCCGYINKQLTLADRLWTCPSCGAHHDQDVNAAKNILEYALDARSRAK